jgi:integrase
MPVMIAISVGNGSGDAQGSERGLEYDTMSGRYAEFVETEVLPRVEKQYNLKLTRDPNARVSSSMPENYFVASAGLGSAGVTERVVWHALVKLYAAKVGFAGLAPHNLRRSCAKLCHSAGGELEQIQFLLGYVSVQTTERYLGCKQRIRGAVNDLICIEP